MTKIVPLIVFVSASSSAMYNIGGGGRQFDLSEFSVGDTREGSNVVNTEFEVPSFNSLFNLPSVNVYSQNSLNINNQQRSSSVGFSSQQPVWASTKNEPSFSFRNPYHFQPAAAGHPLFNHPFHNFYNFASQVSLQNSVQTRKNKVDPEPFTTTSTTTTTEKAIPTYDYAYYDDQDYNSNQLDDFDYSQYEDYNGNEKESFTLTGCPGTLRDCLSSCNVVLSINQAAYKICVNECLDRCN